MTNRLSMLSRHSSRVVCLLAVVGLMYACKDEFILDDEKPSWLTSSIYESLDQRGNYRTYLKLLADKDVNTENGRSWVDVLSRTGSKTVFVANDEAWDAFFAANAQLPEGNPWHNATSYEKLTPSQKLLLIHTSMLNNAIVMENLASTQSSGREAPSRGEYMRRYTDIMVTDSITYVAPEDVPFTCSPTEKDYWERFRNGEKGIYLAPDTTVPMMLHFTDEFLSSKAISDEDFEKIMGRPRKTGDVHIYDALLQEKDGVCENGYVNVTEKPICPLTNMAEAIRTNGQTNIFSHILDRFSAPFYSETITKAYQDLHPDFKDSIFVKRYFSENNWMRKAGYQKAPYYKTINGSQVKIVPQWEPAAEGKVQDYNPYKYEEKSDEVPYLKFDPGWNGYYDEKDLRTDMAAMFVPSDKEMWNYFQNTGEDLLRTYYAHEGTKDEIPYKRATTLEELYEQIDCIPVGTIQALINNMMERYFVNAVPSKWDKLTNDAQDELFDEGADAAEKKLDHCILCSNGVIFVMNMTCVPADYRSVAAPAYISETNKIMKAAIYGEFMNLNYYAYLKAMKSKFTLFMPSDSALWYYYDPASMKSNTPRVIQFEHQGGASPVKMRFFNYVCPYSNNNNPVITDIGKKTTPILGTQLYVDGEVVNRLKDILETHTIVHDETNPMTREGQEYYEVTSDALDEYYLSKNGNAVKVVRDAEGKVIAAKGGFQLENERYFNKKGLPYLDPVEYPGVTSCEVYKWRIGGNTGNGNTYILRAPLVPTYRSVYSIFTNDFDRFNWQEGDPEGETPYSAFYELCRADDYGTEIEKCGLVDASLYTDKTKKEKALEKYMIFIKNGYGLDQNVQFFNNYRYTVFVPSNDAVQEAIDAGLPTWEDIHQDYLDHRKPEIDEDTGLPKVDDDGEIVYTEDLATRDDSLRIKTKITYLINFVRYHFADNSIFADKTELSPREMVTSSYDSEKELFCKIHVDRVSNGSETELRVCDDITWAANNNSMNGAFVTIGEKNVLARDISCVYTENGVQRPTAPVKRAMKGITISSSSAAVIHSIPGYLNHVALGPDGRHDGTWKDKQSMNRYLKRYAIR